MHNIGATYTNGVSTPIQYTIGPQPFELRATKQVLGVIAERPTQNAITTINDKNLKNI